LLFIFPAKIVKVVEESEEICGLCSRKEVCGGRKRGWIWEEGRIEIEVKVGEGR
jgi:hypothetical protein